MNNLKEALEKYLACGSEMGQAKQYILAHLSSLGLKDACTSNAVQYLNFIHKEINDIELLIVPVVEALEAFKCNGSANSCNCFTEQKLKDLLLWNY